MGRPVLRSRSRQRGGTFTLIALGATMLIMVSASLYVDATRLGFERQALAHHRSQAREATFAGVEWAIRDQKATGQPDGQGRFELGGPVEVQITYKLEGPDRFAVTVTARARDALETLRATLEPFEGSYRLVDYRFGD